jgi:hypothetical protein
MADTEIRVARARALPFVQLSTEIIRDQTLSPNAKTLYAIIATFADLATRSYQLYRSELAELMGRSTDTVDRAAKELVMAGVLTVEQQHGTGNVLKASIYTIHDVERGVPDRGSRTRADIRADAGTGVAAPARRGSRTRAEGVPAPMRQKTQEPVQEPVQEREASQAAPAPTPTAQQPLPLNDPPPKPRSDRGTRLPEDWEPDAALQAWTRQNCPTVGWAEVEKFRNYWVSKPGKDGRKTRWDLVWKNWAKTSHDDHTRPRQSRRDQEIASRNAKWEDWGRNGQALLDSRGARTIVDFI